MPRLHDALRFVFRVVWHIRHGVEKLANSMPAVRPSYLTSCSTETRSLLRGYAFPLWRDRPPAVSQDSLIHVYDLIFHQRTLSKAVLSGQGGTQDVHRVYFPSISRKTIQNNPRKNPRSVQYAFFLLVVKSLTAHSILMREDKFMRVIRGTCSVSFSKRRLST